MNYAPDKDERFPGMATNNGGGNNNNGGGRNRMMPEFQPGQLSALAGQLNMGFDGGQRAWRNNLRNAYEPTPMGGFNFGGGNRNGNGNGGKNDGGKDPRNPGGGDNQTGGGGGFTPSSPRNAMMPMQGPQMGLFRAPQQQMQMQQPQQGGMGDIPPEVLAFIRSRGV